MVKQKKGEEKDPTKLENGGKIKDKPTDEKTPADHEEDVTNGSKETKRLEDLKGIGPVTANKLRELGYTLVGIATGRADEIAAEMKISFVQAKAWVMTAQEAVLSKMVLKTATQQDREKKLKQQFIPTGSLAFNDLLGGGFATMATTGLSGRYSTGKTQAIFDGLVECLSRLHRCPKCYRGLKAGETCPKCGEKEVPAEAAYIETEPNTFNLDRLKQIAKLKKVDPNWDKLFIAEADQIPTAKAQFLQYKVVQKALENGAKFAMVAVDSFTAKFRPGYSRREMLPVRTREFTEHFLLIEYLAARYNIAWVLSCQVIGAPDPGQSLGIRVKTGDSFYPVGGEYLLHSINTWVGMQQVKTELWQAILYDSSYLPRGSRNFMLSPSGLINAPE
jgi:DNA repair protein RadA